MTASKVSTFNKRLKSARRQPGGLCSPPPQPQAGEACIIDYLTFSFSLDALIEQEAAAGFDRELLQACLKEEQSLDIVACWLFRFFFAGCGDLKIDPQVRGFRHFYTNHFQLAAGEDKTGFIAFGGDRQKGTATVQLTGAGCAHVEAWDSLQRKLESASARITRVDVAFDDFEGTHDLGDVRELYEAGEFTTNGRPPAMGEQGFNDASGRTIYIGKNIGNQQLCAYEKGKQQGNPESPWLRLEGRFGSKYREIPLDVLTRPTAYFCGHFPALGEWVVGGHFIACRMQTAIERSKSNLIKALFWMRHQYGGVLEVLAQATDPETFARVVNDFRKSKLPAWATATPQQRRAWRPAVSSHAALIGV